jgi:hypothetical protein
MQREKKLKPLDKVLMQKVMAQKQLVIVPMQKV